MNSEIEFGVKIKNSQEVMNFLDELCGGLRKVIEIKRRIFRKLGSEFFFRLSKENVNGNLAYTLSLKEDILSKGISEGLKVSKEIDIKIGRHQVRSFRKIISLLGYKLETKLSKTRYVYKISEVLITVDKYPTVSYLEVEGKSKSSVMEIAGKIPYKKL